MISNTKITTASTSIASGRTISISQDLTVMREVDKEAIVKDVVSEILSKDDLIQDYITPFLIKHLEKYLANPDILFEKDRKIKELEERVLYLEGENNRLSEEIGGLISRVSVLESNNDRIKNRIREIISDIL